MQKKFTALTEQGEDGYLISDVVELPGCHTQAKTMDELLKRTLTRTAGFQKVEKIKNG